MLTLSSESLEQLSEQRRRQFVADCMPVARREFPELWVHHDDQRIEQLLLAQCDDAAAFGLLTARGAYTLFALRARLGPTFPAGDDDAWARAILAREGQTEAERLDALEAPIWGTAA